MLGLRYFLRSCCVVTAITLAAMPLGSCSMAKNQMSFDRSADKSAQDYRDAFTPLPVSPVDETAATPDFQPLVSMPADLKLPSPLVTVSVNQTVSLRDLMFELAEQSGVDLELDPQIRGSIIFTAKERPFNEVVSRICEMSGLRYTFKNNILRVELDRPYLKTYKVDYLNVGRKSSSTIKSDISVSGGGGTVSAGTSSNADISNSFTSNLWKEIDDGLKQILTASDTYLSLATRENPVAVSVPPPMPVVAVNPDGTATTPLPLSTVPPSLNVTQTPAPTLVPGTSATYSISKETGVVSIFASERQHKMVQKLLNDFRRVSMIQVLIEAKVLEVSLKDEFSAGINWGNIGTGLGGFSSVRASFSQPGLTPPSLNVFNLAFDLSSGENVQPVISALSRFGTVRALSSPRVTVMNSQPAVVNVTNNRIYFDITTTTTPCSPTPCSPTITQTAKIKTAPEGVLMNVLPTVNPDTGEILLAIRPTVSKITAQVDDPINVGNKIPELSVQEIDSIIKIQSGQTLVMGGLMRDNNISKREGIPVLSELPFIGGLFRNHGDGIDKSELVILLRATIVPGTNADDADRKVYKDFGQDRRPMRL